MKLPRFSLKTLFGIVTILAIACGWFVFKLNKARHQREIVKQVRDLKVYAGADVPFESPTWLNDIRGKDWASNVNRLDTIGLDDQELEQLIPLLRELPNVIRLNLVNTDITDKHLKGLMEFQSLKLIYFDGPHKVTHEAVEELRAAMPHTVIHALFTQFP
jgi:hypothetical protein